MFRLAAISLSAVLLHAAEFQTGQAARLVLMQSSFSSHDAGIHASSLSYAAGRLYATETVGAQRYRLSVFELGSLPSAQSDLSGFVDRACAVCAFRPSFTFDQQIPPDKPAVIHRRDVTVAADAANHRVLIWRHGHDQNEIPDTVLDGSASPNGLLEPVSVTFDGRFLFVGDAARHRVFVWNSLPAASNQAPDAILGSAGPSPSYLPGPDTIRRPDALASDGENLFVSDTASARILVFTAADTQLPGNALSNAASLSADPVAPGTLANIAGRDLSESTESAPDDNPGELPKKLAGVQVFLNGATLPLLSVSPTQVRTQIPYDVSDSQASSLYIRTEHPGGRVTTTNATVLRLNPATPGLFAFAGKEPRGGMVLHTSEMRQPSSPVTSESPASPGEQVVIWATGLGNLNDTTGLETGKPYENLGGNNLLNPVSAIVNGQPAEVASAGLPPGSIGIYEVRVIVPETVETGSSAHLVIMQNGYLSNTVTFPVRNTPH